MAQFRRRNTGRAQELRKAATPAEKALWLHLQNSKLGGYKFSRQIPIGPFFADFVCRRLKLVVELDGFSHDLTAGEDAGRTDYLERNGYRVIRFMNEDVLSNPEGVIFVIGSELVSIASPPACGRGTPRSGGGGNEPLAHPGAGTPAPPASGRGSSQ